MPENHTPLFLPFIGMVRDRAMDAATSQTGRWLLEVIFIPAIIVGAFMWTGIAVIEVRIDGLEKKVDRIIVDFYVPTSGVNR